mgnify:FL=1
MKAEVIQSKAIPSFESIGIGHAVKYGELLFLSGQIPIDSEGEIIGLDDATQQTTRVYEIIESILEELGGTLDNIVKLTTFYTNPDDFQKIAQVRKQLFNRGYVAASSSVCVQALPHPDALVEVEAVAILGRSE